MRKRRKNADDNIRRLERRAFASEDASDIIAYWKACLRAGELPKPSYISKDYNYVTYTTSPKLYKGLRRNETVRLVVWEDGDNAIFDKGIKPPFYRTPEEGLSALIEYLEKKENPRRRNGDDLLRKLEREAMRTYNQNEADVQAWIRLWREQIRRGITPTPNQSGISTNYWWVLPISMTKSSLVVWWPDDSTIGYTPPPDYGTGIYRYDNVHCAKEEIGHYVSAFLDAYEAWLAGVHG